MADVCFRSGLVRYMSGHVSEVVLWLPAKKEYELTNVVLYHNVNYCGCDIHKINIQKNTARIIYFYSGNWQGFISTIGHDMFSYLYMAIKN